MLAANIKSFYNSFLFVSPPLRRTNCTVFSSPSCQN
jgi:hypothetical protein